MIDFGYYNADCMDIMRQLPDKSVDLAIVDPIYGGVTQGGYMTQTGAEWHGGKARAKKYHNSIWQQQKTGKEYFVELFRVSKNQVVWGGNYFAHILPVSQGWIVWDKQNDTSKYADCEMAWTSFDRATRTFRFRWNGMLQGDMANKEERIHPCHKPIPLYTWILANYAKEGDIILDTHVGSASSLIACEKMGFRYIGCEIDETYYDLSRKRLDTFNSQMSIRDLIKNAED